MFCGGGWKRGLLLFTSYGAGVVVLSSHTAIHPTVSVVQFAGYMHTQTRSTDIDALIQPAVSPLTEAGAVAQAAGAGYDMATVGGSALDPNELSRVHRTLLTQEATPDGGPGGVEDGLVGRDAAAPRGGGRGGSC